MEALRKSGRFGRGNSLSGQTQRLSFDNEGAVKVEQATWADGGGITGSWKGYMAAARAAFMQQLAAGDDADVFEWCMQVAAEDDALSTHSVVELPVPMYAKRVDTLVTDFLARGLVEQVKEACAKEASLLEGDSKYNEQETLALALGRAVEQFLFEEKKYTVASKQTVVELEVYTPYRIYMHNVLPQTCGTPAVLAAVLSAILKRLAAKGALPAEAPLKVVMPTMGGVEGLPFTQLASEEPVAGLAHATPAYVVKDCLRNLKMGFWPWEWSPTDSYGFVNAAQAALGQDGRFGQNRGGTFVPAKGRPFGDVQRALNATERLVLIGGDPMEQRDYAVLLLHVGREAEALDA